MTRRLILFALWCLLLLAGSLYGAFNAFSFFSDDENRPSASGQAGPRHK